ncbi:hypothetical protein NLI96_g10567 [Meripilus lineatus]|uniref:Uncharacterized protein n=1 Tax=Meripilus lineatus TaxID=2056292 RepID=A0AAD5YE41_9APHY|nr:hypothetical protein NLI96_g10567 [Physisporinus lineatus]
MKHGPSTSEKRRRARDLALANEAGDGPQGSTQPVVEQSIEPMDETPDEVATMPPFNTTHMDRWISFLHRENRVDVPGFMRPQPIETEEQRNALRGMLNIMELVHMRHQVTRMFDVFNNTRRLVSELMQDVVGSDARFCRMLQDRISDVDTMDNEMPRYLFDADEIANIGTWLSLNEPVPDTARSPSPPQDGEEEEQLIWSDTEFMGGSPKKD